MSIDNAVIKTIENLSQIVRSFKCSNDDKVDGYLQLFRYFQSNKDESVVSIGKNINSLLLVVQKHLLLNDRALTEGALSFLGQALSSEEVVKECQENALTTTCTVLCSLLEKSQEKSVILRTWWCFSHQVLPEVVMKKYIKKLVTAFIKLNADVSAKSETLKNEALRVFKRFCEQCPDELEIYVDEWIPQVFKLLVTDVAKNRQVALDVVETGIEMLAKKQSYMQKFLLNQLNKEEFSAKLDVMFHNDVAPVHVLNCWACMLRLLGESFFELNRVRVTNPLLKIAEKSFGSRVSEVTLALNNLWRALIDTVFTRPDEFGKRMEKIFLLPIRIRYKNEVIAQESLKTQWHLICKIASKINQYLDKAVIPLLDVYLKNSDSTVNDSTVNKSLSTTPSRMDKQRRNSLPTTPKSPYNSSPKIKLLAGEMLMQLLTEPTERQISRVLKLEMFTGPRLNNENIVKNCQRYVQYLLNITESCGMKHETFVTHVWISLVVRLREITENSGNAPAKEIWTPVLLGLHEVIDRWMSNSMLSLKILLLIPESVLKVSIMDLKTVSVNSQMNNENGLVSLFIVQLLLHKNYLHNKAFDLERYFIIYERVIGAIFSLLTNQLINAEVVFDYLKEANSDIGLQNVRWRLWSTLTSLLTNYVTKTNDVNQSSSCLHYDFKAVLKALSHPLKFLDLSKLSEGTMNELMKVWKETFKIFIRSVALLSGVEINLAIEKVFSDIKMAILTGFMDSKLLHSLVEILYNAVEQVDHSDVNQIYTSNRLTPTKMSKKLSKPLGNLTSLVDVIGLLFTKCFELSPKEGKVIDSTIIQLLDVVETFSGNVENSNGLTVALQKFGSALSTLIDGNSSSLRFSSKVTVKTEKVLLHIFSCVESNNSLLFHSELLDKLEAIIIKTLASPRKPLRNRAAQFWNVTFGKSDALQYSDEMKRVLDQFQKKLNLSIPGTNCNDKINGDSFPDTFMDDTAQFPDHSSMMACSPNLKTKAATSASPLKIRGSFMPSSKKSPKDSSELGSPADILGNFLASGSKQNSPKSPFSKPKGVRRKLPVCLHNQDSLDFVEIKDSPNTKRKRLLTEHQKDRVRERKDVPVMYNNLDQSQDAVLRSQELTQDTTTLFSNADTTDKKSQDAIPTASLLPDQTFQKSIDGKAGNDDGNKQDDILIGASLVTVTMETATEDLSVEVIEDMKAGGDEQEDLIPSSQTQDERCTDKTIVKNRESILPSQARSTEKKSKTNITTSKAEDVSKDGHCDTKTLQTTMDTDALATPVINIDVDDQNNVCETEEIVLFEGSTSSTNKIADSVECLDDSQTLRVEGSNYLVNEKSNVVESTADVYLISDSDSSKNSQTSVDELENTFNVYNMKAKLVVDKLPTARRHKRKRDSTVKSQIGKKQKTDRSNEEEKIENKENAISSNQDDSTVITKTVGEEQGEMPEHNDGDDDKPLKNYINNSDQQFTDIFKFEEDKPEHPQPEKRSRRRSAPFGGRRKKNPSVKVTTKTSVEKQSKSKSGLQTKITGKQRSKESIENTSVRKSEATPNSIEKRPKPIVNMDIQLPSTSENNECSKQESKVGETDQQKSDVLCSSLCVSAKPEYIEQNSLSLLELNQEGDKAVHSPVNKNLSKKRLDLLNISSPIDKNLSKGALDLLNTSSPVNKNLVKNPFLNHSVHSPTRTMFIPSPMASPVNGILKKRLKEDGSVVESPSPPNKRRVSFQLPGGAIILPEVSEVEVPDHDGGCTIGTQFTVVRKKIKEKKKEGKPAVFPELVSCKAPIEKVLPSLTFSRGLVHLVRAQNILTVGDLSALSENQIEALPIHSPKVSTVRQALKSFSSQMTREKPATKSPLVIGEPHDDSLMDSPTPTKDETSLVEEAALLLTPSRHHDAVKPTSLFLSKSKTSSELNTMPELSTPIEINNNPELDSSTKSCTAENEVDPTCEKQIAGLDPVCGTLENKDSKMVIAMGTEVPEHDVEPLAEDKATVETNTCVEQAHFEHDSENSQKNVSTEPSAKTLLRQLSNSFDVSDLTNTELFDVIGKLDHFSKLAMSTLRNRMSDDK